MRASLLLEVVAKVQFVVKKRPSVALIPTFSPREKELPLLSVEVEVRVLRL
jgi:hypothetical protein